MRRQDIKERIRESGINTQYVKPYTVTTIDSDISEELKIILDEQFNPAETYAVWCFDITYIWIFVGFAYLTSLWICFQEASQAGHPAN